MRKYNADRPWVYTKALLNRFTDEAQELMMNAAMMEKAMKRVEKEHPDIFGDALRTTEF